MSSKEARAVIGFEGKVAIVTGAGRGLGRSHALLLAERGAAVVVNDLGGALDGSGGSAEPAEAVAAEIRASGGRAVADDHDVASAAGAVAIVDSALEHFGQIDVVVNNAGVTGGRKSFADLSPDEFAAVLGPHLLGTANVTRAAWPAMASRGRGRVVNTTSGVGLWGMSHASAYAAAKMGIVGLTVSLAHEGAEAGIAVNAVAPIARTRMADGVFGSLDPHLDPSLVSSVVAYLAHDECTLSGRVLSAGAGRVAEVFIGTGPGLFDAALTPEELQTHVDRARDRTAYTVPDSAMAEVALTAACHGL
ncbi:SDR family NAD(P)-dependent oxidoreductase [Nocardioides sp. YIM 152315]|uniref:SDR family NAD(P)-dependent oxidoreductase n=1 Tax=Nocardioides sp. YIM 152315 TaxID=3031760 RepID=UPI0023DC8A03|nr:SDR family NAD(P)-dependent oxidoreductase [Nocardioides sp. YIM 152315]MDF1606508.1 SDR family NAD(P)-dependent oxidoreductase [Nocardioides sp. YIM 152315]